MFFPVRSVAIQVVQPLFRLCLLTAFHFHLCFLNHLEVILGICLGGLYLEKRTTHSLLDELCAHMRVPLIQILNPPARHNRLTLHGEEHRQHFLFHLTVVLCVVLSRLSTGHRYQCQNVYVSWR